MNNTTSRQYLFNAENLSTYKEAVQKGAERVSRHIDSADQPFSGVRPGEIANRFQDLSLDEPLEGLEQALDELESLYLNDAVYFHHPRYVAHLNCPIVVPAIVAELILSSVNSSLDTWDQSAGGTFIERKLINWTADKIGFSSNADGIFTSGGTQSNLKGLLLARNRFCQRHLGCDVHREDGLPPEAQKLRILTSSASHFSVKKAAGILGLGYDSVISVPCNDQFQMDVNQLTSQIQTCRDQGLIPMAVVATAGTTDFGSIDPLEAIADTCREHDLWMHVDAAYGCGLLLSEERREWLTGIKRADSVTVDYHKSFLQPVSCSASIVREARHLSLITHHAEYLNPDSDQQEGKPNQVDKSIQTTRRFDALKLWLTLRTMGPNAIGKAFDAVIDLAREGYQLLRERSEIDVIHQPELSTLVFRFCPENEFNPHTLDEINNDIREAIYRSGRAAVAATTVNGRRYLKFTLLNPRTTLEDLREIIDFIEHHGRRLLAESQAQPKQEVSID